MRLLHINGFIKKTIKERCYYVRMSDAKFPSYSHFHQVFIAHGLYNGCKIIDVIEAFFFPLAISKPASFVFQYITKTILFQLEYPSDWNNIGLSWWTHYFPGAVFNKGVVFAFHIFFLFWPVMSAHSFI